MGIFRRKVPSHLIPIHPHNATSKDWIILLEAGTSSVRRLKDSVSPDQCKSEKL